MVYKDYNDPWLSDDKKNERCLGRRSIRIFSLSIILIIWAGLSFGFYFDNWKKFDDSAVPSTITEYWNKVSGGTFDKYKTMFVTAWVGILFIGISCFLNFIFSCIDSRCLYITSGIVLILGSLIFFVSLGLQWKLTIDRYAPYTLIIKNMPIRDSEIIDNFFRGFFPGFLGLLLSIDCFCQIMRNANVRLFLLMLNLMLVCLMLMIAVFIKDSNGIFDQTKYIISNAEDDGQKLQEAGYIIIFLTCTIFLVFFILLPKLLCCNCDPKTNIIVRILFVFLLLAGAIVASIGFYQTHEKDLKGINENDYHTMKTIGLILFLVFYIIALSVDIAVDDFITHRQYN